MKLDIDQNGIICVDQIINESREYVHNFSWFNFSSYDKIVVAKHKKEIKLMNWKNIGDGMSVFCFLDRNEIIFEKINKIWFWLGFSLFQWFDEETWRKTFFLYKISENELEKINKFLNINWYDINLVKTEKWIFVNWNIDWRDNLNEWEFENIEILFSLLFSLTLIYWKLELKNSVLISAKIHIPLFGVNENKKDIFDNIVKKLSDKWIFLQKSIVNSNNWIVYQISIQDYELLCSFKNFCKDYVDIEKVQKYEYKNEISQILNDFVKEDNSFENGEDYLKKFSKWIIKLLNK